DADDWSRAPGGPALLVACSNSSAAVRDCSASVGIAMAPLDLTHWLDDVPGDSPTGPNLELDPDFGKLERAAQPKPERQYGNTIVAAEDPDWKEVAEQASALLERSRDLRVLVHLAIARLHVGGLPAFAEVLGLITQVLQTRWDEVHPRLDPE